MLRSRCRAALFHFWLLSIWPERCRRMRRQRRPPEQSGQRKPNSKCISSAVFPAAAFQPVGAAILLFRRVARRHSRIFLQLGLPLKRISYCNGSDGLLSSTERSALHAFAHAEESLHEDAAMLHIPFQSGSRLRGHLPWVGKTKFISSPILMGKFMA